MELIWTKINKNSLRKKIWLFIRAIGAIRGKKKA